MPTPTPTIAHLTGCPQRPERVERYATAGRFGERFTTTRCIDCGAHDVEPAS